ncbi:LIC_13387 family protein [Nocardia goodfellowii]
MTAMTSTPHRTIAWAGPVHTVGAGLLGAIGLAHLLVVHAFNGQDPTGEEVVNELSRNTAAPLFEGGRQVTVFGLNTGYSVGMGLCVMLFGALAVAAARRAPQLLERWSLFNVVCTAAAAGTCWIACLYFPEPPIVASALATACFAAVLVAGPSAKDGARAANGQ